MKKILIPTDFTPIAHKSLSYSVNIAQKNQAALVLLHVTADTSGVENKFEKFIEEVEGMEELTCEWLVKEGKIVDTICQVAEEIDANLIVMGTHNLHQKEEYVAAGVIDAANCSVLTIPEKCTANMEIEKIAFATDYLQVKTPLVLGTLTEFARIFDAEVHVLNVKNEAQKWDTSDREITEDNLEYFLESIDHSYNFTDNPDLEKGIYDFIKGHNIDLLAMMPRTHNGEKKSDKGRLTENIALKTEIPLLTFHEQ